MMGDFTGEKVLELLEHHVSSMCQRNVQRQEKQGPLEQHFTTNEHRRDEV
jgi:hypothetical protein